MECFNEPALSEARWVLKMMDSEPFLAGLVAQICVQKGAEEVCLVGSSVINMVHSGIAS